MLLKRSKALADQVNDVLRNRILQKHYAAGSRLPSESELSEEFGVSRATIRSVLATLASEGLILRRQGNGTFVNERIEEVNAHLGGLWEFSRLIESSGYTASIKPISVVERAAGEGEAARLGLAPGEAVLVLTRLFLADARPVILAENVLPVRLLKSPIQLEDGHVHLKPLLQKHTEREIAYAIIDLRSINAPAEVAATLQQEAGTALLQSSIVFYDRDNQPLVLGTSYHDTAILRLRLVQAWA